LNWEPLCAGDPLPGDPAAIQQLSSLLSNYANECSSSATKLTNLGDIDWESDAATVFRLRKEAYAPKLNLVSERLSSSSSILGRFGAQIGSLQASALNLRATAQQLQGDIQSIGPMAGEQQSYNERQIAEALVGKPPTPWPGPDYISQESALKASYLNVQFSFDQLVTEYATFSQWCASQLQQVSHDALTNSTFSEIEHYVGDINDFLPLASQIIHDFADAAALVALVTAFIPGLEWIAPIATAVFLGLSVVSLGIDAVLFEEHKGGVTWEKLSWDVFNIATVGIASKATNIVKLAEGATDARTGVTSFLFASKLDPDLAAFAGDLEGFATRLPFESNVLNIVGEANSSMEWVNDHFQTIDRTWGKFKSSLSSLL
jgi:hypothetical protein